MFEKSRLDRPFALPLIVWLILQFSYWWVGRLKCSYRMVVGVWFAEQVQILNLVYAVSVFL